MTSVYCKVFWEWKLVVETSISNHWLCVCVCMHAHFCPAFCNPMDCSLPGSSVHRILQAIVLEWIAISFSSGSSWPRDQTWVSRIVDRPFTMWATRVVSQMGNRASLCPKLILDSLGISVLPKNWTHTIASEKYRSQSPEIRNVYLPSMKDEIRAPRISS